MPPKSPRSFATNCTILLGLLLVLAGYSPARSDTRGPDRVELHHAATADYDVTEIRVFEGDPQRFDLVASADVVATVFVQRSGRGLYGDFRASEGRAADAFYAARPSGTKRALLDAVLSDAELLGPRVPAPTSLDR